MSNSFYIPVPVIISTIKHSNTGKFVIVEGNDDIFVYRVMIELYKSKGIKIIAAGGKDKVLEIFDKINGTSDLNKAIFIVDQDSWIFTKIPKNYNHSRIICTSGYSIENDIYIDNKIDDLMKGVGVFTSFNNELETYLKWFSLAISRFINGKDEKLDVHPNTIFKDATTEKSHCALQVGEIFPQELYDELLNHYALKFRGKCLLPLAIRALGNRPGGPKYNNRTIMEQTAITGRGIHLNRIFSMVESLA